MDLRAAKQLARSIHATTAVPAVSTLARFVVDLPDESRSISCYFCSRPASTMEAGYAVCEAMFHESQRRRIEAPAVPERPTHYIGVADDTTTPKPATHIFDAVYDSIGRTWAERVVYGDDGPPEPVPAPAVLQHWLRDDGALVLSIKPITEELAARPVVVYLGDDVIADDTAPPVRLNTEESAWVKNALAQAHEARRIIDRNALNRIATMLDVEIGTGTDTGWMSAAVLVQRVADIVRSTGRNWGAGPDAESPADLYNETGHCARCGHFRENHDQRGCVCRLCPSYRVPVVDRDAQGDNRFSDYGPAAGPS